MFNAIFYLLRTGCQWRPLPHDFPPWTAVHNILDGKEKVSFVLFMIIYVKHFVFCLAKVKMRVLELSIVNSNDLLNYESFNGKNDC